MRLHSFVYVLSIALLHIVHDVYYTKSLPLMVEGDVVLFARVWWAILSKPLGFGGFRNAKKS